MLLGSYFFLLVMFADGMRSVAYGCRICINMILLYQQDIVVSTRYCCINRIYCINRILLYDIVVSAGYFSFITWYKIAKDRNV